MTILERKFRILSWEMSEIRSTYLLAMGFKPNSLTPSECSEMISAIVESEIDRIIYNEIDLGILRKNKGKEIIV
jgi:hypothetical protein